MNHQLRLERLQRNLKLCENLKFSAMSLILREKKQTSKIILTKSAPNAQILSMLFSFYFFHKPQTIQDHKMLFQKRLLNQLA